MVEGHLLRYFVVNFAHNFGLLFLTLSDIWCLIASHFYQLGDRPFSGW
jgi:hypothetical protein